MKTVDTNYLVRLFTRQPEAMADKVIQDLKESMSGDLLLSDFVISELMYVLQFNRDLSYKRADIVQGVRLILSHPAWKFEDKLHELALIVYEESDLDYVDCLVIAQLKLKYVSGILTFDKGIKKYINSD
jgi:predicted nucleic-acid-binding protein